MNMKLVGAILLTVLAFRDRTGVAVAFLLVCVIGVPVEVAIEEALRSTETSRKMFEQALEPLKNNPDPRDYIRSRTLTKDGGWERLEQLLIGSVEAATTASAAVVASISGQ